MQITYGWVNLLRTNLLLMELPIIAYNYLVFSFFICFSFQNSAKQRKPNPPNTYIANLEKKASGLGNSCENNSHYATCPTGIFRKYQLNIDSSTFVKRLLDKLAQRTGLTRKTLK